MRLPRPYIPLSVRVQVAYDQARKKHGVIYLVGPLSTRLKRLLRILFPPDGKAHLDHNPALQNRQKLYHNGIHVAYSPPANDPEFLIYRKADDHKIKTLVRGDGAQHSDAALARKNKNIARNRDPKVKKRKWPSRPFPKRAKQ